MKKTGGVLVPPDDQNKALNVPICRKKVEVKTLTKTASGGSMLPYMDKSKLFHILKALYKEQDQNAQDQEDGSVLIIDACPRASRNESFKTCLELSAAFMASMTKSISRYITVHLVFDQCNTATSLKQATRERHKGSRGRTSYTCKDSTPMRMQLKVFLSESKTKVSLTLYIPKKTTRLSHKTVAVGLSTRDGVTTKRHIRMSVTCVRAGGGRHNSNASCN